jgi:hypothetical protein
LTYRITPETCDILSHPLDSQTLIFQSQIPFFAISKTENIQAVIDRHKDERFSGLDRVCDNFGRVTNLGGSGAECDDLRATMYPDEDRKRAFCVRLGRRCDI